MWPEGVRSMNDQLLTQDMATGQVVAAMDRIRANFVDGLGDRMLRIEADWLAFKADRTSGAAFHAVVSDVHRIAGIAGSLGFKEIGESAVALDRRMQGVDPAHNPGAVIVDLDHRIEAFLDLLEDALG
jgi:HPt (histidine-containing phosphotransfer) domain-containing protein